MEPERKLHWEMGPPGMEMGLSLLVFLAILLAALSGVFVLDPPLPVPAQATADRFSAVRAFESVREIARAPHIDGTPEIERVREFLLSSLRGMGLEPEVHEVHLKSVVFGSDALRPQNIIARLPGTHPTGTILLVAHYDSRPDSPGAADDASGVAALLESARVLRGGPPLQNTIALLLTDGEEAGLLGSSSFVEEHPLAGEVTVAFNFDARGSRGPSILVASSPEDGRLISEFARTVKQPVGSSLGRWGAEFLGRNTDFTVLRKAGIQGLDFAFIDGPASYHAPLDRPENLGLASLQHHGEIALALARCFGELDLQDLKKEEPAVFFNGIGGAFVYYPLSWAWPLAAAALVVLAALLAVAIHRRAVSLRALPAALGMVMAWAVTAATWGAVVWLCSHGLDLIGFKTGDPLGGDRLRSPLLALFLACGSLAVTTPLVTWTILRYGAITTAGAGLLLWAVFLLALHLLATEGGYLATWPLLVALPGYAALVGAAGQKRRPRWSGLIAILSAAGVVAFLAPSLPLFYTGFLLNPFAAMAVTTLASGWVIALIAPALSLLDARGAGLVALFAAGAALVSLVAANFA